MTEEKKKFGLGKGCLIVAGVVVGLGVIGAIAGGGDKNSAASSNTANSEPVAAQVASVSAKTLSAAFQENEAKAKLAYDGQSLKVDGKVKDIDLDFADNPVIRLAGSGDVQGMGVSQNGKMTDVAVNGLSKEQAAQINKGQDLTVICEKVDEVMGGPQLSDCQLAQ
jgi:hypothetical protein